MSAFQWIVVVLLVLIFIQAWRIRQYTYLTAKNIKVTGEATVSQNDSIIRELKK